MEKMKILGVRCVRRFMYQNSCDSSTNQSVISDIRHLLIPCHANRINSTANEANEFMILNDWSYERCWGGKRKKAYPNFT